MLRLILQVVGSVIVGTMRLTIDLVFWIVILTMSLVWAVAVGIRDKVVAEPRLIFVFVYVAIGAWILYSFLYGIGPGVDRLSVLEGL